MELIISRIIPVAEEQLREAAEKECSCSKTTLTCERCYLFQKNGVELLKEIDSLRQEIRRLKSI